MTSDALNIEVTEPTVILGLPVVRMEASLFVSDARVHELNQFFRERLTDYWERPTRWHLIDNHKFGFAASAEGTADLLIDPETRLFVVFVENYDGDHIWFSNFADWETGDFAIGEITIQAYAEDVLVLQLIENARQCSAFNAEALLLGAYIRNDWKTLSWADVEKLCDLPGEEAERIRRIYYVEADIIVEEE